MIATLIKYFILLFCNTFIFTKLLKKENTCNLVFLHIAHCLFVSIIMIFVRNTYALYTLVAGVISSIIYFNFIFKIRIHIAITFTIISFSLSYGIFSISSLIGMPLLSIIFSLINDMDYLNFFSTIVVGLVQIILTYIIFKSRRLQSGLIFSGSKVTTDMGVFLSALLILGVSLIIYYDNDFSSSMTLLFIFIVLTSAMIYLWIHRYLKSVYIEKVNSRNLEILNETIESKNNEIKYLKNQNAQLSKIIHKGNKIIPALELAVTDLIQNHHNFDDEKAQNLIQQLKILTQERKGIVTDYEKSEPSLPLTNIAVTDGVLRFLYNRAANINCSLDFSFNADIKYLTDNIIDTNDLNTILADLVENAIISTKDSDTKKILIVISIDSTGYRLDIFDSGICFDSSSFSIFGLKRTTTHKDTGGSGIGIMTTLEILKKVKGSFEIDEALNGTPYTKCVSVCFDNENQFRVHSTRTEVLEICKARTDITLI